MLLEKQTLLVNQQLLKKTTSMWLARCSGCSLINLCVSYQDYIHTIQPISTKSGDGWSTDQRLALQDRTIFRNSKSVAPSQTCVFLKSYSSSHCSWHFFKSFLLKVQVKAQLVKFWIWGQTKKFLTTHRWWQFLYFKKNCDFNFKWKSGNQKVAKLIYLFNYYLIYFVH